MQSFNFNYVLIVLLLQNSWMSFSKEDEMFRGRKREKRITSLDQVGSNKATASKYLAKMPIIRSAAVVDEPEKLALDQVLNNKFENIGKLSLKQAMDQLEEFKKSALQQAEDRMETFGKSKSLKSEFNMINKHGKLPDTDKIHESLESEIRKLEESNKVHSIPHIKKIDTFGKVPLVPGLNKIELPEKLEIGTLEKFGKIALPLGNNKIEKNRKLVPKLEFNKIDELTIKKLEKSVEPVKLASLDKAALSNKELKKSPLKRDIDEYEHNKIEKLVKHPLAKRLDKAKSSLDKKSLSLKRATDDGYENSQILKSVENQKMHTKNLRDEKTVQLKRDVAESDLNNKIEKVPPKNGILDTTKTSSLMGSIVESEKNKFERTTESIKNATFGTAKIPWDRKNPTLNLVYSLDAENVAFPNDRTRAKYLQRGQFVPRNVLINRVQFFGDKAFVTMPKLKRGVPFSVGKISLLHGPKQKDLKIEAFPSWAIHRHANISGIVNAIDILVDEHATLWILDSGVTNTLENPQRVAPPKIFAVDLRREQVIKAIDLSNFIEKTSRLQHISVESGSYGCQFVYVSDASNRGLIIWDVCNDFGSKIILPKSTQPEMRASNAPDILYLNLFSRNKTSLLGLTFFSSDYVFAIPTHSLQNLKFGTVTGDVSSLGRKPAKMVMLGSDHKWVYFRYAASADIYAWDASTEFRKENFKKLYTGNGFDFATQVAVGYKKFVWALESNFQDYHNQQEDDSGLIFSIRAICRSSDLT